MNILVSACLLGQSCRYDGETRPDAGVLALMKSHTLIPFCPEQAGGLKTPRSPAEIKNGRVVTREGEDVTDNYRRGAEEALKLAKLYDCRIAVMKERSPSCSPEGVYDGTFTKTLVPGPGVTAALLKENGVTVIGESELTKLK